MSATQPPKSMHCLLLALFVVLWHQTDPLASHQPAPSGEQNAHPTRSMTAIPGSVSYPTASVGQACLSFSGEGTLATVTIDSEVDQISKVSF